MRIVVISDTHGNYNALESVILAQPKADFFIHLGDGERDVDRAVINYPNRKILHIRGNCDYGSLSEDILIMSLEDGSRLLAVHGNNQGVNYSLDGLKELAVANRANIVLYGHTHCRHTKYDNGIYFLNPGSASCPRDFKNPSYGYIDITPAGIFVANAEVPM